MSQYFDDDKCPTCHGFRALGWCSQCAGAGYVVEDPLGSQRYRKPEFYENKFITDGAKTCPTCNGHRAVPCTTCRGTGRKR